MTILRDVKTGQPVSAKQWNEMVRRVNRKITGPRVIETPHGWHIRDTPFVAGSIGSVIKQFKLKRVGFSEIDGDLLICRGWDGEVEGEKDVYVAKSFLLRRSPFDKKIRDGITYDYFISSVGRRAKDINDNQTEFQVVIPKYVIGDLIYATSKVIGEIAGVVVPKGIEKPIWLDNNNDARAWARRVNQ